MDRRLSPQVQELIRASENVIGFASDNNGLREEDCEAVLFYARELIREIQPQCVWSITSTKPLKSGLLELHGLGLSRASDLSYLSARS